jgi:hypothetical protein
MWYFMCMASSETVNCPYCGETIKRSARACPHCGSDEQTGWSDSSYLDGIDLGDEVDYEELRRNEFTPHKGASLPLWQLITAGAVLLFFIVALVYSVL